MALHKEPYGLVYNDDGSLCVTLRNDDKPFEGVTSFAVEEGTTNLVFTNCSVVATVIDPNDLPVKPPIPVGWAAKWENLSWNGDIKYLGTLNTGDTITVSGWYMPYSTDPSIPINSSAGIHIWSSVGHIATLVNPDRWNKWYYFEYTYTATQDNITAFRIEDAGYDYWNSDYASYTTGYWANVQFELKPFATSFVDGSRPDGRLSFDFPAPSDNWVVSFWVNPHYFSTDNYAFQLLNSNTDRYNLKLKFSGDVMVFEYYNGSAYIIKSNNGVFPNEDDWSHVVYVFDAPTTRIYLNGEKVAEGNLNAYGTSSYSFLLFEDRGTLKTSGLISNLYIGKAKVGDKLIWNDDYIKQLYQAKRPFSVPPKMPVV